MIRRGGRDYQNDNLYPIELNKTYSFYVKYTLQSIFSL